MNKQIDPGELDFLLRFPVTPNVVSPVDFLSHQCWGGIKALSNMEQFRDLDKDIEVCTFVLHIPGYGLLHWDYCYKRNGLHSGVSLSNPGTDTLCSIT